MRGGALLSVGLAGALLAPVSGPRAQEAPAGRDLPVLTLEEAVEIALRHNPALHRARSRVEVSGAATRRAWGAFLPAVSGRLGFGEGFTRSVRETDFFGRPIENPEVTTQVTSSSSQDLSLSLELFDGGRRLHSLAGSRAGARAAEGEMGAEAVRLRAAVVRQYYEALRARRRVRVEERLLETGRREAEAAERRFRLAQVQEVDVLAARLEAAREEAALEEARSEARKALLELRRLLAAPDLPGFRLADEDPPTFDPGALDVEELVRRALAGSPEVAALEARLEAARARVRGARAGRWPRLSLSAGLARSEFGPDGSALFRLEPTNQSGRVSLSVSLPLFDGFQTGYAVAEAEGGRVEAEATLREKRLAVEAAVRSRWTELAAAYRRVGITREAREIAARRLRLEEERYRLGLGTFLELQEARRAHAEAERGALDALFAFAQARATLEEALGGPLPLP